MCKFIHCHHYYHHHYCHNHNHYYNHYHHYYYHSRLRHYRYCHRCDSYMCFTSPMDPREPAEEWLEEWDRRIDCCCRQSNILPSAKILYQRYDMYKYIGI